MAQERIDTDHLRGLLAHTKDKVDLDKEALKKATRYQTFQNAFELCPVWACIVTFIQLEVFCEQRLYEMTTQAAQSQ